MSGLSVVAHARPVFTPGSKTIVFDIPDAAARGDVLLVVLAGVVGDSCPVPAGWTRAVLGFAYGGGVTIDVYVSQVDEHEPSSVTFTAAIATSEWQGTLIVTHGGNPGTIIEASAIGNYVAVATPNAPSVSSQQAINLELCAWSTTGANVPVPPAGFTVIDGYASALATSRSWGIGYVICNEVQALPVRGATGANPSTGSAISIVLRDRPPAIPVALVDVMPGNIGLRRTEHTNIALRFDAPATALIPDQAEQLDDLHADASSTMPVRVPSWTGHGRSFDGTAAMLASDLADGNTLQQRDLTVRAILALDLASAAGEEQALIVRGISNGSVAEMQCYALFIKEQEEHPGFVEVWWAWQDADGNSYPQPPGVFQSPGDGVFFELSATRRWTTTERVVTRYYVSGQLIGELVTGDGAISGGTTGTTTVGGRKTVTWAERFFGVLDEMLVDAIEVSGDELELEHARLVANQPEGVEMVRGLAPPGAPWQGDYMQRWTKATGQGLGQPISFAAMVRALLLPDRAPLEIVQRWERVCSLVPKPRDSLDARRARILGHLAADGDASLPSLRNALAELFALAAADVSIIELSQTVRDGFDDPAGMGPTHRERYLVDDQDPPGFDFAIAAGELLLVVDELVDMRWEPSRVRCAIRAPLTADDGVVIAQVKISNVNTLPSHGALVGLYLHNRVTLNSIWFGIANVGGTLKIGYRLFVAGVGGGFVSLLDYPGGALWVRAARTTADIAGHFVLSYSSTGPTTGFVDTGVDTGITDVQWVGVAATCHDNTIATLSDSLVITFDDLWWRTPNGIRPFFWYAYRDPALPGVVDADINGADLVVQRLAPAHTWGRAIASTSVIAGDPVTGLAGRGPAGVV